MAADGDDAAAFIHSWSTICYDAIRSAFHRAVLPSAVQALYRGNGANVLRLVPEVALKFGLNDQLKIMFAPADGRPMSFSRKLAAGATAGVLKVTYPSLSPD